MISSNATIKTADIEGISSSKTFYDLKLPLECNTINLSFEVPSQTVSLNIFFPTIIENTD